MNNILNEQPINVFVVIAETLEGWKNSDTELGKSVLLQHYQWAAELKANNKIILAGPTDFDLTSTHQVNPIGHTTGVIVLNVDSREEAIEWAEKDPFHINGFRNNKVHSFKITITEKTIFEALQKLKNQL